MNIRPGAEDAARQCRELAREVTLAAAGSENEGFLLGAETVEDYCDFLREGITFLAEDDAGRLLGFLIAYLHDSPLVARHASWLLHLTSETASRPNEPFCYVEKIAVSPQARRRGIAQALYARLFEQIADRPLLAAIVESPHCNHASQKFHGTLGFERVGAFLRQPSADALPIRLGLHRRQAGPC